MNEFGGYEDPISRAFWGPEDLDEEPITYPTFSLESSEDLPKSIKTFVIISGNVGTDIMNRYIISNAEKVCTINSSEEFNVAAFYKLDNDIYVCHIAQSIDITCAGRFVETISDTIKKSERVFVFTETKMYELANFEANNINEPTLWRSLSNQKGKEIESNKVSALKNPNYIVGVAAGVIGLTEMLDIPAILYILYVSEDAYNIEKRKAMLKLFAKVTKYPIPKIEPDSTTFDNNKLKLYT
ncbi:uncharacterized protein PSMG1 [Venturia canescens]|uniref:uncharacterized protein PSMG1 n=1 Tax=Venturia canescens TaxID=32260 RepID=UPI001C9CC174|nr:uncharacterized protein LOC122411868 [Venturia canescens]